MDACEDAGIVHFQNRLVAKENRESFLSPFKYKSGKPPDCNGKQTRGDRNLTQPACLTLLILWGGFVAVGYTVVIRVKAHNHSVIIDCVGLGVDGSGRVYSDEFPLPQEIALPNAGTV